VYLVGSVLGVPAGVLHNVTQNDTGSVGVVVTHANVRAENLVLLRDLLELLQELSLGKAVVLFILS